MAGIKESKELVKFVTELVKAIDKSLEDGEFALSDIVNFYQALTAASSGLSGIQEIPAELKDLQPEEVHELCEYVKNEFQLRNHKHEQIVESALEIGVKIYDLILLIKTELPAAEKK